MEPAVSASSPCCAQAGRTTKPGRCGPTTRTTGERRWPASCLLACLHLAAAVPSGWVEGCAVVLSPLAPHHAQSLGQAGEVRALALDRGGRDAAEVERPGDGAGRWAAMPSDSCLSGCPGFLALGLGSPRQLFACLACLHSTCPLHSLAALASTTLCTADLLYLHGLNPVVPDGNSYIITADSGQVGPGCAPRWSCSRRCEELGSSPFKAAHPSVWAPHRPRVSHHALSDFTQARVLLCASTCAGHDGGHHWRPGGV